MMGRSDTPVRRVFNYATEKFLRGMPILYVLTVVGVNEKGEQQTHGLFVGDDIDVSDRASKLSRLTGMVERPLKDSGVADPPNLVYMAGQWSIYRTCMAIADGS